MGNKSNPFPNSFIGEFRYTVDNRGRTNFPAPFRHALSEAAKDRLVIARGLDDCLLVFPRDVWEKHEIEFNYTPYSQKNLRLIQRHLYYGARETGFDGQGRITIPERLQQYAKIGAEALIVGAGDRVEIWNPDVYEKYIGESTESVETILEEYLTRLPGRPAHLPDSLTGNGRERTTD
ncbi:MAG: division/cell wall cluster transcriptional repressor MraZ [Candidatus Zixiibacteriota bacterium]|nr:MAG: division/cell wall cluster transcriptional repressor MraZ [candidate division Zixibacteria bacterium]